MATSEMDSSNLVAIYQHRKKPEWLMIEYRDGVLVHLDYDEVNPAPAPESPRAWKQIYPDQSLVVEDNVPSGLI